MNTSNKKNPSVLLEVALGVSLLVLAAGFYILTRPKQAKVSVKVVNFSTSFSADALTTINSKDTDYPVIPLDDTGHKQDPYQ